MIRVESDEVSGSMFQNQSSCSGSSCGKHKVWMQLLVLVMCKQPYRKSLHSNRL